MLVFAFCSPKRIVESRKSFSDLQKQQCTIINPHKPLVYFFFFFFTPPPPFFFFFLSSGGGIPWMVKVPPRRSLSASGRSCKDSFKSFLLWMGACARRAFSRFFQAVTARGARCPRALDMVFQARSKRTRASPRLFRQ